jgi:hypothetical protein
LVQHLASFCCLKILEERLKGVAMKKFVHKLAILWMSLLSITGLAKSKTTKPAANQNNKVARQQVILLDEFELSAFHNS